ncbi:hypothetical protein EC991_005925 [Linnemannia zychae]|nr:hypothetical protein EC991_005925 [Linnemannia zychae]
MTSPNIPIEIVLAFGEQFDGSSLYAGLQVCQEWNNALAPIAWATLNEKQWSHASFPIKPSTKLSGPFGTKEEEQEAEKLLCFLNNTLSFKWSDTKSPGRQTPFPPIHQWMPRLKHFSLTIFHAFSVPKDDALMAILNPANLPNLESLVLSLPPKQATIPLEKLYPMFEKLEEFSFLGFGHEQCVFTVPRPINGTFPPVPPQNKPWSLKRLTVDRPVIPFLTGCIALEHLSVIPPMDSITWGWQPIDVPSCRTMLLNQLVQLPNLNAITLGGNMRRSNWVFKVQGKMEPDALWIRTIETEDGPLKAEDKGENAGWTFQRVVDVLLW